MDIMIVILAVIVMIVGFYSLSQATLGVGILAVACFLGIVARLLQASRHNKEIKESILASLEQASRHHEEIEEWVKLSLISPNSKTVETPTDTTNTSWGLPPENSAVRSCPTCNIPMVVKVATQGPQQGKSFYVCPNYKQCKQSFLAE